MKLNRSLALSIYPKTKGRCCYRQKKASGDYVEGVVISDVLLTLFRSVVPALSLALAQTEKSEKAVRAELMKKYHCSELDAVHRIAEAIKQKRAKGGVR